MGPALTVGGYSLSLLGLLALGSGVAVLGLGLYPLLSREALQESLFFFLFCLVVATWLLGTGLMVSAPDRARALRWLRVVYVGTPLIPAALYTVATHSLGIVDARRWGLAILWSGALVFLLLFQGTELFIEGLYRYDWGRYPDYTPAGAAFVAYVVAGVVGTLVEYGLRYRHAARTDERRRAGHFLAAFGVGGLGALDFLPAYGVASLPIGPGVIPIMVVLLGRTLRHHHLSELTPAFAADHIFEVLNDPVLVVGRAGAIRVVNPAVGRVLGFPEAKLVGAPFATLFHPGAGRSRRRPDVLGRARVENLEVTLRDRSGDPVSVRLSSAPVRNREGRRVGTVVVLRDVRERKALRWQAMHDALTGLPNRVLYEDRLEQLLRMLGRRPTRAVAVLYVDLDDFKGVNDELGHAAGDRLLEVVADRLTRITRTGDTAARIGGDEFTVLLGDLAEESAEEEAREVARRTVETIVRPVPIGETTVRVEASIGVAVARDGTETTEELTRRADRAMYRAKNGTDVRVAGGVASVEEERPAEKGRPG